MWSFIIYSYKILSACILLIPVIFAVIITFPRFFMKLSTSAFARGQYGGIRRCMKPQCLANSANRYDWNGDGDFHIASNRILTIEFKILFEFS